MKKTFLIFMLLIAFAFNAFASNSPPFAQTTQSTIESETATQSTIESFGVYALNVQDLIVIPQKFATAKLKNGDMDIPAANTAKFKFKNSSQLRTVLSKENFAESQITKNKSKVNLFYSESNKIRDSGN